MVVKLTGSLVLAKTNTSAQPSNMVTQVVHNVGMRHIIGDKISGMQNRQLQVSTTQVGYM